MGCPFGNLAAELSTTDEDIRVHLARRLAAMQGQARPHRPPSTGLGVLREGTDPDQLAHALLAQYQGIILLAKLNDSGVSMLAPALHDFIDGYLADTRQA